MTLSGHRITWLHRVLGKAWQKVQGELRPQDQAGQGACVPIPKCKADTVLEYPTVPRVRCASPSEGEA